MRKLKNIAALCAISGMLAIAGAARAACPDNAQMVGVVQAVHGPRGGVKVTRAGSQSPVGIAMPLCTRDVVDVAPGADLSVKMFDGGSAQMGPGTHEIPSAKGSNVFQRVLQAKLESFAPAIETYSHNMVGRDAKAVPFAFTLDSLNAGQARVSPHWQTLWLSWTGGVGPYSVSLTGPGQTASVDDVIDKQVAVPVGKLAPGSWTVAVTDLTGRMMQGTFTVSGQALSPAPDDGPVAEIDAALAAVALASQPNLDFEAQQILANAPAQGLDRGPIMVAITCSNSAATHRDVCPAS